MPKLLGIDYGEKYIGLAVSDEKQRRAFLYRTIEASNAFEKLGNIVRKENIEKIIIGLPLSLSGQEGPQAKRVKIFGKKLAGCLNILIDYEDERLTTKMSGSKKQQKEAGIDDHQFAAQEILQSYIDKSNV